MKERVDKEKKLERERRDKENEREGEGENRERECEIKGIERDKIERATGREIKRTEKKKWQRGRERTRSSLIHSSKLNFLSHKLLELHFSFYTLGSYKERICDLCDHLELINLIGFMLSLV